MGSYHAQANPERWVQAKVVAVAAAQCCGSTGRQAAFLPTLAWSEWARRCGLLPLHACLTLLTHCLPLSSPVECGGWREWGGWQVGGVKWVVRAELLYCRDVTKSTPNAPPPTSSPPPARAARPPTWTDNSTQREREREFTCPVRRVGWDAYGGRRRIGRWGWGGPWEEKQRGREQTWERPGLVQKGKRGAVVGVYAYIIESSRSWLRVSTLYLACERLGLDSSELFRVGLFISYCPR